MTLRLWLSTSWRELSLYSAATTSLDAGMRFSWPFAWLMWATQSAVSMILLVEGRDRLPIHLHTPLDKNVAITAS